jgi:hypothetical protein
MFNTVRCVVTYMVSLSHFLHIFFNKYVKPAHISSPLGTICAAGNTNP